MKGAKKARENELFLLFNTSRNIFGEMIGIISPKLLTKKSSCVIIKLLNKIKNTKEDFLVFYFEKRILLGYLLMYEICV